MAGLYDTDIRLTYDWQLTAARTGDAPTCSNLDCYMQDIQLEAISQEGELFYDEEWGWGLLEFLHSEDDDLTRLEMTQRVKAKLGRREEVEAETIALAIQYEKDVIRLLTTFQFAEDTQTRSVELELSRVSVEVISVA